MTAWRAIDEERRRLDVTQRDLCRQARVAPSTYTRSKRGHVQATDRTLDRLRNALALLEQRQSAGAAE